VQEQFRCWFERWGRPGEVRLDNGIPWGGWYDVPTVFALWLFGLGVGVHFNPPRQPQENGVIEQSNGSAQRWVDLTTYGSVAAVQTALDESDEVQRSYMSYAAGQSRLVVFPELQHSGREYSRVWEQQHWDLTLAQAELERYQPRRRVCKQGRISLYYRQLYVGSTWAEQEIEVCYDVTTNMWVLQGLDGRGVKSVPAVEVNRDAIMTLQMYCAAKAKRRAKTTG
jgi:hypothetical protein